MDTAPDSNWFSNQGFLHQFGAEMVLLFPLRNTANENHQEQRTLSIEFWKIAQAGSHAVLLQVLERRRFRAGWRL
jgi:hypothetical protein